MAYTATVTGPTTRVRADGTTEFYWSITEVEARDTSEFWIEGAPTSGKITLYRATKTAGTGTTINPKLFRVESGTVSTQDHIGTNSSTAASINDSSDLEYNGLVANRIRVRSSPNSVATDHAISTEIVIIEGF